MSTAHERLVEAGAGVLVPGNLTIPEHAAQGIVLFAHGSGSSRLSPRNRQVAQALNADGFATLLFDLLTPRRNGRADVPSTSRCSPGGSSGPRVAAPPARDARPALGYFGASTGAAAALMAAATAVTVSAVVSRGGRPDLAAAGSRRCARPRCSSSGGATPRCSSSTARPSRAAL